MEGYLLERRSEAAKQSLFSSGLLFKRRWCVLQGQTMTIYDDIDLAFGRLRLKQGSSDGGHNGIKSIDKTINKDHYWKLKIGVGRPPSGVDPANYVLSKFNNEEREEVEFIIEDVIDVIKTFSENREVAIKQASERRIIDVI